MVTLTLRELRSNSEHRQVRALSLALGGVCILRKGAHVSMYTNYFDSCGDPLFTILQTYLHIHTYIQDLLSAGDDVFVILGEAGSPRR